MIDIHSWNKMLYNSIILKYKFYRFVDGFAQNPSKV